MEHEEKHIEDQQNRDQRHMEIPEHDHHVEISHGSTTGMMNRNSFDKDMDMLITSN